MKYVIQNVFEGMNIYKKKGKHQSQSTGTYFNDVQSERKFNTVHINSLLICINQIIIFKQKGPRNY